MTTEKSFLDYHEEDGCVLWFIKPIQEPPWCGTPEDDEFPWLHLTFALDNVDDEAVREAKLEEIFFVPLPEIFFAALQHPLHKELKHLRARVIELEAKDNAADYTGQIMRDAHEYIENDDGLIFAKNEDTYGAYKWMGAICQARREAR